MDQRDETFYQYWQENREKEKHSTRPFFVGLAIGLCIGIAILLVLESGWDERAVMVANSRLSSFVLLLGILLISLFMAFFYRKFSWEMREQRFRELEARKNRHS
ncbi:MAG TPA: hypothetical protein VG842_01140 [Sediminibacterium sp.]|nr:hypothetical protein [Sediminibacterium sp.]